MKIIFQNENFVVCDKAALVLSVPAREKNDNRECLGLQLQQHFARPIFPVHRLDYEVSGLIVYALNSHGHQVSQTWFLEKKIQKKYLAITAKQNFSHWPEKIKTERHQICIETETNFFWRTQILRGKRRSYESAQGEWAETTAKLEKVEAKKLHWSLSPLTGKPHQLRFELSRRGFPICGDQLYGSSQEWSFPGIALRAVSLDLQQIKNSLGLPQLIQIQGWDL